MKDLGLTPEMLLQAYAGGIFPMAEARDSAEIFWVDPERRGVMPLECLHISRSLAKKLRRGGYSISVDRDFAGVVAACAARDETWINDTIHGLYLGLHDMGQAHSLEVWSDDGVLIGGVYGVTLGAAFFGESMFSRSPDGSKIALVYLVDRLVRCGFQLFDTQFITPHLSRLGAVEISRSTYRHRLKMALSSVADFCGPVPIPSAQDVLQRRTQTS